MSSYKKSGYIMVHGILQICEKSNLNWGNIFPVADDGKGRIVVTSGCSLQEIQKDAAGKPISDCWYLTQRGCHSHHTSSDEKMSADSGARFLCEAAKLQTQAFQDQTPSYCTNRSFAGAMQWSLISYRS